MPAPAFVVISPVRDEESFLPLTIRSMIAQTVRPHRWIIVDDGSRDATRALCDGAARSHPWIRVVHRNNRGFRQAGTGVIAAFYDGVAIIGDEPWDFIVKFDGDLSFDPDYFERCLGEFSADPSLGIGGGTCCKVENGARVPEFTNEPPFHVRGPTKIYRRQCFEAIGGLIQAPGWDTVDLIKANMLGWRTRTFANIPIVHHRPTGGAYSSWQNWEKNGLANYITGYDPVFMACKCLLRLRRRPRYAAFALWTGYCRGLFRRVPQVADKQMIKFLRRQQWRALTFRPSIWR